MDVADTKGLAIPRYFSGTSEWIVVPVRLLQVPSTDLPEGQTHKNKDSVSQTESRG